MSSEGTEELAEYWGILARKLLQVCDAVLDPAGLTYHRPCLV